MVSSAMAAMAKAPTTGRSHLIVHEQSAHNNRFQFAHSARRTGGPLRYAPAAEAERYVSISARVPVEGAT
jgi:hypothetical protein